MSRGPSGIVALRLPRGSVRALLVRPRLWAVAVRQARRLAPPGWWRRPPHLPVPPPDYLRFRMVTAYGGTPPGEAPAGNGADTLSAEDLIAYLEWCRAWPDVAGAAHRHR